MTWGRDEQRCPYWANQWLFGPRPWDEKSLPRQKVAKEHDNDGGLAWLRLSFLNVALKGVADVGR
jgi:hypothetical protein